MAPPPHHLLLHTPLPAPVCPSARLSFPQLTDWRMCTAVSSPLQRLTLHPPNPLKSHPLTTLLRACPASRALGGSRPPPAASHTHARPPRSPSHSPFHPPPSPLAVCHLTCPPTTRHPIHPSLADTPQPRPCPRAHAFPPSQPFTIICSARGPHAQRQCMPLVNHTHTHQPDNERGRQEQQQQGERSTGPRGGGRQGEGLHASSL